MSFQISWISVKQYNEKKKSHRNGVKITTLPSNQHTPAPPQLTPPLPLNITSQRNELVLVNHIGEKNNSLCKGSKPANWVNENKWGGKY